MSDIVEGDGSAGWPEEAPFDAILAAASGSHVPDVLMRQLSIGGSVWSCRSASRRRPVAGQGRRLGEEDYAQEDLGAGPLRAR